ncbi:MAG: DUF2784 domain-containing protein [Betaproteobacteria bacterium]|nr:DUF2784 domain-containing protein [Betaproteobacteria bacterium]
MPYNLLADLVLLAHFGFILFVGGGGLLVARWPRLAWLHLPAAAWGALVEIAGIVCPLTPLENHFRQLAGETAYAGDFIGRYLLAVIYPTGLTRPVQIGLGLLAVAINLAVYAWAIRRLRKQAALPQ